MSMNQKKLFVKSGYDMSRFTILIIFFVVIFGFSHAKSEDIQHDYTQQTCLAITTDDQSYSAAVEQIISIPIVNEWICQLKNPGPKGQDLE